MGQKRDGRPDTNRADGKGAAAGYREGRRASSVIAEPHAPSRASLALGGGDGIAVLTADLRRPDSGTLAVAPSAARAPRAGRRRGPPTAGVGAEALPGERSCRSDPHGRVIR